ncbi:MAG TPA: CoA-binding protein [candidate division Zixibacteria bacterium]|nr:CoA-binding protein [candidate division Zixibacteria bacterium]
MTTRNWSDQQVAFEILRRFHVWAVVGCSPDPMRASHGVSRTLLRSGYEVMPIYPREVTIHGIPARPDLATAAAERSTDHPIEVVDIFRASHRAGQHVDEAIAIGARAVWLQLGVWDEEAAERAAAAGLLVVMDRCPAIDLPMLHAAG